MQQEIKFEKCQRHLQPQLKNLSKSQREDHWPLSDKGGDAKTLHMRISNEKSKKMAIPWLTIALGWFRQGEKGTKLIVKHGPNILSIHCWPREVWRRWMRRGGASVLLLSGKTFTVGHGTCLSAVLWDAQHFLVTLGPPSVLHL